MTHRTRLSKQRCSWWRSRSWGWRSTPASSRARDPIDACSSESPSRSSSAAVIVLALPNVRAKVMPGVRSTLSSLWVVARTRRKRMAVFGGAIASELLYALALGATCLAYGVDLTLPQLVFINTSASVLSGLIPVPGGIGAAEAALSAGLIAMGVDESTGFAIALTQRLCTFYLPPIWGFLSLRWLTRKGYL